MPWDKESTSREAEVLQAQKNPFLFMSMLLQCNQTLQGRAKVQHIQGVVSLGWWLSPPDFQEAWPAQA